MDKLPIKNIWMLLILSLVLSGCTAAGAGSIGWGIGSSFQCDKRYEKGKDGPFFRDVQIPENSQKAVIILYQPFWKVCGSAKKHKWEIPVSINGRQAIPDLAKDHFTAFLVNPQKVRFSALRKGVTYYPKVYTHKGGELTMSPKAGKRYFLRWSNDGKYRWKGFTRLNAFQLVDEQTALKELEGMYYLSPLKHKAPVFDKKTGEAL